MKEESAILFIRYLFLVVLIFIRWPSTQKFKQLTRIELFLHPDSYITSNKMKMMLKHLGRGRIKWNKEDIKPDIWIYQENGEHNQIPKEALKSGIWINSVKGINWRRYRKKQWSSDLQVSLAASGKSSQ